MNPEIDLKHFGASSEGGSGLPGPEGLVSPPRRIITRYVLPLLLLSGFIAVSFVAFRETLERPVEVSVVLPVPVVSVAGSQQIEPAASATRTLFQAPGWIEPEPYPIIISALRTGTVHSIDVLEGQSVTSGTIVARLVSEEAELAVQSARSALDLKKSKHQAALEKWKSPVDLVESVESAKATGDRLQAEARRLEEMWELARVEADVGSALSRGGYEASLETLRKRTQLSASRNQLAETHAQIRLNSATLSAASERLALRIEDREAVESTRAEVAAAEAALADASLQLKRSVITAPTSGTVMRLYASPGSMLTTEMDKGMVLASMYQPEHLQVRVDVPLAEAAKVKPGLYAEVKVEALPDKTFQGELINIVPEFDIQKNTLPVKVRISEPDKALRPEMIARVEFKERQPVVANIAKSAKETTAPLEIIGSQFLIPSEAIRSAGGTHEVYVVGPDGKAKRRPVTIAEGGKDGMSMVTEGLNISDKIIAQPGAQIQDGTPIKVLRNS